MAQNPNLDCIIIGPSEIDFHIFETKLKAMDEQSAAYRVLRANSALVRGKMMTYMQVLNQTLEEKTGQPHCFHICELPSLAVCHLKSFLYKQQLNTEVINFFNHEKERLIELLAQLPNAVAITTTLYVEADPIIEVVKFIRQHNPYTKIIVGGPYIYGICESYDVQVQDFVFGSIGADIYIHDSQGELTLARVLHELRAKRGQNLSGIPNLVYTQDNGTFCRTKRMLENNNIDESAVDWRLFEDSFYTPTVQVRTSRSCNFSCAFCQYPAFGGTWTPNLLEVIENQFDSFKAAGVKNVIFVDDSFNVPLPRFKNICRMMIKKDLNFNWFSFFRCSNADDEAFDLMQDSGCKGVFLGIESGDQTILSNMNKFAKVDKYKDSIHKLNERGILTLVSLIVGFPGETLQTVQNTIDFMIDAAPKLYTANLYYHYTNTPIHRQAAKYGIQGSGYHWKHNTMDWQEAWELMKVMYETIQESIICPVHMFDFWAIPYLMGKGMSMEQITDFMRSVRSDLLQGL